MQCNCWLYSERFRNNPITPDRLLKVLTLAIYPTADHRSATEATAAGKLAVKFLSVVNQVDLPQLQGVIAKLMAGVAVTQPDALVKLLDIYQEAKKKNSVLPPANTAIRPTRPGSASSRTKRPSTRTKSAAPPPPKAKPTSSRTKPPPAKPAEKPFATREDYDESRSAPRPKEACRSCDGKGYRIKVDKENVMKETKVTCSKCGGSGREPSGPPKKGGRGFGRRGPHVEETEEEEDINKKTDSFLKKRGFGKWGQ